MEALWTRKDVTPYPRDSEGWELLAYAASQGHTDLVQLLLEKPFTTINSTDFYLRTLLLWANFRGYSDIGCLLSANLSTDSVAETGNTHYLVPQAKVEGAAPALPIRSRDQFEKAEAFKKELLVTEH
ncbi:hypothetical protein QQX98_003396 [Neonectria punicea]|uniref:Ankyrin repeat protein n=1 Tax=Neonectria punicea TaxID=979145 RepID=A0ABR1HDK3_9HYPO